jgi:hypothetical protein
MTHSAYAGQKALKAFGQTWMQRRLAAAAAAAALLQGEIDQKDRR